MPQRPGDRISTTSLLRLLRSGDTEEVVAAALVLGALGPSDPRVVPALARRLESAPSPLKAYLLDAIARLRGDGSLEVIATFLRVEGSLREQAVRLFAARGPGGLRKLRALLPDARDEDISTFIRIASAVGGRAAADFLLDLLPGSGFDRAKQIYGTLAELAKTMDRTLKRHAVDRLLAFLSTATAVDTTAEIAAVKILARLPDPRAFAALLARTAPGRPPSLRESALEALAHLPPAASRTRRLVPQLTPLLGPEEPPVVSAAALRLLRASDPGAAGVETLLALARSGRVEVARVALGELRRHPKDVVIATLLEALKHPDGAVSAAAAGALEEMPEAVEDLLAAHENPEFAPHQETLRTILSARPRPVSAARFRRLVASFVDGTADPELLKGRLLILATLDRNALNRAAESRAEAALAAGDAVRGCDLLEPLVRGRLATPSGRYLLAVAHLLARVPGSTQEDGHFDRALHLIGPLARLPEWDLRRRLVREELLDPERRAELTEALAARPGPEGALGAALLVAADPTRRGEL